MVKTETFDCIRIGHQEGKVMNNEEKILEMLGK